MTATTAEEWRRYAMLPIAAAVGYATSSIHIYGIGPYIEPITREFGWSRTQVTSGLSIAILFQGLASIPIGMAVDRMGARPLALIGALSVPAAWALLGTATGATSNWYALWFVLAVAALAVQGTIWTSAVASRFIASRGLALAVTLCGASVANAFYPWLAATLIANFGWKTAFMLHGAIWAAFAFPMIFFFFRGARDQARPKDEPKPKEAALAGMSFLEGLRSTIYLRLLLACLLFTFTVPALTVHFVPILADGGFTPVHAAEIAALIGLFSIIGRLSAGFLLDRFPASYVGAIAFLLPIVACLALIASTHSVPAALAAAILFGLTSGAEIDVVVYLTTRHFGLRNYGALFGGLMIGLAIGSAFGSLAAARVFDVAGNYKPFLWLTIVFMVASSIALFSLPKPLKIEAEAA